MSTLSLLTDATTAFLTDARYRRDPYPLFKSLQTDDPVHQSKFGVWLVTGYEDVHRFLADDRFSIDVQRAQPSIAIAQSDAVNHRLLQMMSMRDPPDHGRLRRVVSEFFLPRSAERFRTRIEQVVDWMLKPVVARGSMDVIADLARDLPVYVSCLVVGVPRGDWSVIRRWTEILTSQIMRFGQSDDELLNAEADMEDFGRYVLELAAHRRAFPQDDDVLSALALAEDQGDIDKDELVASCLLLLISGRETATNMIGNSLAVLLNQPDQLDHVRTHHCLSSALDECLRFESPVRVAARRALCDVQLGGRVIREGAVTLAIIAAANRDPACFATSDRVDVTRKNNRHLAFGGGVHFCLGRAFARISGEIVLERFVYSFTDLESLVGENELLWSDSLPFRGLQSLPVRFRQDVRAGPHVAG
jgi:pimeloyl-[acyl-carrier protein] synthase